MPDPTPFYPRTSTLCKSMMWRYWGDYFVPSSYEIHHDVEYYAIRNSAALIDITPLYKYDITGPDAFKLVDRVMTRNFQKCQPGQVFYTSWCDENGKTLQDGTVFRIREDYFRVNAADPIYRWLRLNSIGMTVEINDVTDQIAGLALQGPLSREILQQLMHIEDLKFFRLSEDFVEGIPVIVSRTGYTGDLGYEIWVSFDDALRLYDTLMGVGSSFGITPAGNLALDMSRVEAGFILIDVDYTSAEKALIPSQLYSPYEIGLGWTVHLDKEAFVGRKKLEAEKKKGSARQLVGLEVRWNDLERLFQEENLPPQLPTSAWRGGIPLYFEDSQVGKATSGSWSPILKKYIVLGTVDSQFATRPNTLEMELTVEYKRKRVPADIVKLPFFKPERARA